MSNVKPIYVIGHRNPDTDSICSSLAYAALKQALGQDAVAARTGQVNAETKYALEYFGVEAPMFLSDLYPRVKDVMLDSDTIVRETDTLRELGKIMQEKSLRSVPVTDEEGLLAGIVTVSDLAQRYFEVGDHDNTYRFNNYQNRYHWRHIDLMDVLSGYQARTVASLDDIAKLCGFPGKLAMDGSAVQERYTSGDIKGIRDYCETDAANTYIDIVADILGENTVSEEVLAFLRVENRLTDLNMAEVSLFEVGEYSALKSRPGRDGMEMDHIPSKAALCQATCRHIETKIERDLNDKEVAAVLQVVEKLGGAIAIPKEMHEKLSRTIGGRNTDTRIRQDSSDIIRAIKADLDAYTPELRKRGYSDKDIEMIYNSLVNRFNHVVEQICQQK